MRALSRKSPRLCLSAGVLAVVVLLVVIGSSPRHTVFDELFYVRYAELLDKVGLSREFVLRLPGSPGPLVAFVQYAAKPLTGFRPPAIRFVSALFLLASIVALSCMLRRYGPVESQASSFALISAPPVWQMAGLALTDMPAVFFLCASLMCLEHWLSVDARRTWPQFGWAALGGLALGVAGLGRQTVLAACAAPLLAACVSRRRLLSASVFGVFSLVPVFPVFWIWGGLVPPSPLHVSAGLSPSNAIASLGYAGLLIGIIAPGFLVFRGRLILLSAAAGLVLQRTAELELCPYRAVAQDVLGDSLFGVYTVLAPCLLAAVAAYTSLSTIERLRERRHDSRFVLNGMVFGLIVMTPLVISSNYSSRYTALALPALIVGTNAYSPNNAFKAARILAGAALGVFSLLGYLSSPGWLLPWDEVLPHDPGAR